MSLDCNPLRAAFVCAVIMFLLGLAARCAACDTSGRTERPDGTWELSDEYFRCVLLELKTARAEAENLEAQVEGLERLRASDAVALDRYAAHVRLEERATERAHEALKLYQETAEEADSWYRSPVLWFAVGVVATSVAVVAIDRR